MTSIAPDQTGEGPMDDEAAPVLPIDRKLLIAGILAAVAFTVVIASLVGAGDVKLIVYPVGAVVGVGLVYLALTRFELFVLVCLFLRASLDILGGRGTTVTNPSSLVSLLFMGASLLWLAARAYRGERLRRSVMTAPLLFFAFACFLSTITSRIHDVSITEFSRILSVVVMALVLERLATTPETVRRIMIAALGSALVPLVASFGAYLIGAPLLDRRAALEDGIERVRGTFDQANGFSRYLLFIIIMAVAMYPHLPKKARVPMLIGVTGLGVLMVLTYTRSSWLALLIGLMVVGWWQSKRLLLALVALALGVALFVPSVVDRFGDLTSDNGPDTALTGEGNSLAWRLSYWSEVVSLAVDNPVTGIGLRVTEQVADGAKQPHNDFLRAFVEMGALGLMAYIALLIALIRVAARGLKDARAGWERGVAVGFAGCLVSFVLVSLVANVMSQAVVLWYLFAFAACANAVSRFGWLDKKNALEAGGRPAPISA